MAIPFATSLTPQTASNALHGGLVQRFHKVAPVFISSFSCLDMTWFFK